MLGVVVVGKRFVELLLSVQCSLSLSGREIGRQLGWPQQQAAATCYTGDTRAGTLQAEGCDRQNNRGKISTIPSNKIELYDIHLQFHMIDDAGHTYVDLSVFISRLFGIILPGGIMT